MLTRWQEDGRIATLTLARPEKRNAVSDALIAEIDGRFASAGGDVRVVLLLAEGDHFCAGLDLSEHLERDPEEGVHHSRRWHAVLDRVQFGGLAVVSALKGAVIGGGLEIAAATHVRVADPTAFFQLPEGRRGIFVGGGATVRVGRILGADRMTEMMLTGRRYDADEGVRLGLAHHLAEDAEARARELAETVAANARLSNWLMIQAVSRIGDMPREGGLLAESMAAALAESGADAREGMAAFLERRAPTFQ